MKNDNSELKGRILIVDDDEIVSGMLTVLLEKYAYAVNSVESGEDCLAQIGDLKPDAVILDIHMPGIDGYQVCQQLRERPETHDLPIIFLSGLEALEDRLKAYDVGGDDYIAKPFNPEEIRRKVDIAMRIKHKRDQNIVEKQVSDTTAMTAIFSLGEFGAALKFTRDSLHCRSLQSLAKLAIDALQTIGVESHIQIRTRDFGTLTVTPEGPAIPLEVSVFELSLKQGRIFQFSRRLIINYESVSILVLNLQLDDDEKAGRIRDYAAIICETSEAAVENILLRLDANARTEELRQLAEATQTAIENLHTRYRLQQADTRFELDQMIHAMEDMYVSLGLLESQEKTVNHLIHTAKNNVMNRLEQGMVGENEFKEILERLAEAASYSVPMEEESQESDSIDLW